MGATASRMPGSTNANPLRPRARCTSSAGKRSPRRAPRDGVDAAGDVLPLAAVVRAPGHDRPAAGTDHGRELGDLRRRAELKLFPRHLTARRARPHLAEDRIGDEQLAVRGERERDVAMPGSSYGDARGIDRLRRIAGSPPTARATTRSRDTASPRLRPTPRRPAAADAGPAGRKHAGCAHPVPSPRFSVPSAVTFAILGGGPRPSRSCRRRARAHGSTPRLRARHRTTRAAARGSSAGAYHGPAGMGRRVSAASLATRSRAGSPWPRPPDARRLHRASRAGRQICRRSVGQTCHPLARRQPASVRASASRSRPGSGVGEKRPSASR